MTFDGPGQNAALIRQQLTFRPDWEKVITPVVDYLLTRPDVDGSKIALLGVSQAGYWVTRSVAFEHRIAAAVVDPGVTNVSTTMFGQIPHFLVKLIDAGEQEKFDKDMDLALRFSASTRLMMTFRMRPYGVTSPYEFFTAARDYALTDETIGQITCPVLITDPDHEQFWPGQSGELYDKLSGEDADPLHRRGRRGRALRTSRKCHPRRARLRLARPAHFRLRPMRLMGLVRCRCGMISGTHEGHWSQEGMGF